jgi:hypothetical protein
MEDLRPATNTEDVKRSENWIRETIDLLNQLQVCLVETITAWEHFKSSNGDIDYFSDIDFSQSRCRRSFGEIKDAFEDLEGLQRILLKLSKTCHDSAQDVSSSGSSLDQKHLLPRNP